MSNYSTWLPSYIKLPVKCHESLTFYISASGASAVGPLGEVRVGLIGCLKLILQVLNGASASSPGVPSRFVG